MSMLILTKNTKTDEIICGTDKRAPRSPRARSLREFAI
jgi:hypothetical protein